MAVALELIQGDAEDNFYYEVSQMKTPELLERLDTIMDGCEKNFFMHDSCLCLEYLEPVAVQQLQNAATLLTVAGVRHHVYPWGVSVELYERGLELVGR